MECEDEQERTNESTDANSPMKAQGGIAKAFWLLVVFGLLLSIVLLIGSFFHHNAGGYQEISEASTNGSEMISGIGGPTTEPSVIFSEPVTEDVKQINLIRPSGEGASSQTVKVGAKRVNFSMGHILNPPPAEGTWTVVVLSEEDEPIATASFTVSKQDGADTLHILTGGILSTAPSEHPRRVLDEASQYA